MRVSSLKWSNCDEVDYYKLSRFELKEFIDHDYKIFEKINDNEVVIKKYITERREMHVIYCILR